MNNRWIRVAMVAMLFAVAAPVAHADDDGDDNGTPSTVAPLTGETLLAQEVGEAGGSSTVTGRCETEGESTFHFTVTGTAAGPFYPGTFTESGTIVLGPPGVNQATSFESTFTINSPGGTVTGSKSLVGFESTSLGLCNAVSLPGDPEPADQITRFEATVSYVATITGTPSGSGMDSGTSRVNFQDFQVRGGISNGFSFLETFVSTSNPDPGECEDDDNDDQGDDDCDDQGEDG